MDVTNAIKTTVSDQTAGSGYAAVRSATSFETLAEAFSSALRHASSRVEADATALTAKADTNAANQVSAPIKAENYAAERKEAEAMARERARFDDDTKPDRFERETRADTSPHSEDRDRDAMAETSEPAAQKEVAETAPAPSRDDHGAAKKRDRGQDGTENNAAHGEAPAQAAADPARDTADAATAAAAAATAPVDATVQNSEQVIAAVVSTAPVANAAVRAATGPGDNATANNAATNAANAAAAGANAVKPVANGGDSSNANLMLHGGRQQNNGQAIANQQANGGLSAGDDAQTIKGEQQSALSRMVGFGNRMSVQTSVTNESATLVSQPTSNLASNTVLANEVARSATPTQQQTLHGEQANLQMNQGQMAGGIVQGQTPQMTAQNAQIQAAVGDGKAAIQAPSASQGATPQFQAANGEAAAGTGTQSTTQTTTTQQTAQTNHAQAKPEVPQRAFVDQVSVQITKAVNNGLDRITVQLRPESMGRVEVSMELAKDGRVQAVVTADNRDTLDLLQKDARGLEKALQDAGLNADSDSLSFSLRGEGGNGREAEPTFAGPMGAEADIAEEIPVETPIAANGILPNGHVDIRA